MNQQERDALREKHFTVYGEGAGPDLCYGCGDEAPCDTTIVLEAWGSQEEAWVKMLEGWREMLVVK